MCHLAICRLPINNCLYDETTRARPPSPCTSRRASSYSIARAPPAPAVMGASFKVSRTLSQSRRFAQRRLGVCLCAAVAISCGLAAFARNADLHVVHDSAGAYLEHDHRRVFGGEIGVSGRRRAAGRGGHDAHQNSDLTRRVGNTFAKKHAVAVGDASARHDVPSRDVDGEPSETFPSRFGRDGTSSVGWVMGGTAGGVDHRRGGEEGGLGDGRRGGFGNGGNGNGRGEGGFGDDTVANRLTNNVVGDDDPFVVHAAVPKKTGGRMRGVWDETKHFGLTVEKLAGIGHYGGGSGRLDDGDGVGADEMAASSSSSDRSTTNPQHVTTQRKSIKPTSNTDDGLDWDFDREMSARPKELGDDGEDDEETEAAETSQQKLFDKEAMNRAAPKKRGVFW